MDYEIINLNGRNKAFFNEKKGILGEFLNRNDLEKCGVNFGVNYGGTIVKGGIRGNHYHEKKIEFFFVLSGEIQVSLIDIITEDKLDKILTFGQGIKIGKNIAHALMGLSEGSATFSAISTQLYDEEDDHYYKVL
jgi:dTDP-4-dehydrorhamnose 3,5-epimerase-like enzyme